MNFTKVMKYFNKLSLKLFLSLLAVALIPLFLYIFVNNLSLKENFVILEKKSINAKSHQANRIVQAKGLEILKVAKDYAIWDDAYYKINEQDMEWIQDTITGWIPSNFGMELVAIVNKNKKIIDQYGLVNNDLGDLLDNPIAEQTLKYGIIEGKEKNLYGLKKYNGDLYLIAFSPIQKSYYKGEPIGILLLGKKISSVFLEDIYKRFGYKMLFAYENTAISTLDEKANIDRYLKYLEETQEDSAFAGKSLIIGRLSLSDIYGERIGYQILVEPRDMFLSTLKIIGENGYIVLVMSILIILILSLQVNRIILGPIKNLEKQIGAMTQNNALDFVDVRGPSEIESLASTFNKMTENILAHKSENISLKTMTITDSLTQLYNHRYFYEYLTKQIEEKTKKNLAILFCDIDYFKVVNDINGHLVGDTILSGVAKEIKEVTGDNVPVFRYGGEEFIVVIENRIVSAYEIAENIRLKVAHSHRLQRKSGYLPITVSIGISSYPEDAVTVEDLVKKADQAMFYAKQSGRNQTKVYEPELDKGTEGDATGFVKQELLLESVYTLVAAIDAKDTYTEKHSKMVTKYALYLGEKLKMNEADLHSLRIGGLLHDCGKIGIPDNIIHKSGPLTQEEQDVIKNHTHLGSNIVKYIIKTKEIGACIRYHHERWDGTGYPEGLSQDEIPLHARIICIADAFHAMISDRPYRKALGIGGAFEELRKNKGKQFDPELIEPFIECICTFDLIGEEKELSNVIKV